MIEKKRLVGITIVGAIFIIWAMIVFLWLILDYLVRISYGMSPFNIIGYVVTFLYIALLIMTSVGLLKVKSWSRKVILLFWVPLFIIIIPYRQFVMLNNLPANPKIYIGKLLELLRIGYAISLLIYFTRPNVKEQFK